MNTLIRFSLKRKFLNKSTLVFNLLIFAVIGCIFFADKIVNFINPDTFDPLKVYLSAELYKEKDSFTSMDDLYEICEYKGEDLNRNEIKVSKTENGYEVISLYGLDAYDREKVNYLLSSYQENKYFETHDPSILLELEEIDHPEVNYKSINESDALDADRQTFAFSIVTSLYFTSLSFCTTIATEVIYEKSSKILEMILTTIKPREHFYAKLIAGWLSVILQSGLSISVLLLWLTIRQGMDKGKGLLEFARKMGIIQNEAKTITELFKNLSRNAGILPLLAMVILFLLLGILFIQLLMTVLASFVNNVEEGAAIQTPCYIVLMLTYYLSLMLNNTYYMGEGIGKYLSFVPFFSMLFMPMRLILGVVSWYEVAISFLAAVSAIFLVLDFGSPLYEEGILNVKTRKKKRESQMWEKVRDLLNMEITFKKKETKRQ